MSNYYNDQESVANISVGLVKRGWKVYGYRADQSDSMTDYWSPARWEGIAAKDGYILLVDVYGTSQSGYKKTAQGYTPDYSKIEKLKATINDTASTENEKVVCQTKIDSMMNKQQESTIIIEEYPTFKNANPKACNWHIEKDGEIIAKGKGAFKCDGYLFGHEEAETMKKVNAFIDRIEKFISSNDQLVPVQKEVIKKVTKPVEVKTSVNEFVTNGTVIKLNAGFTGSHYKGELLQLVEVYTYQTNTRLTFVKLGKQYQQLKRYGAANNTLTLDSKNLEQWLNDGSILTVELKEVEEVTYKTVYKKTQRQGQKENLLQGETVEETNANESNNIELNEQVKNDIAVELIQNQEQNGIELKFNDIPSEETRYVLKANGYRWAKYKKVWYKKGLQENLSFAEAFVSAFNDTDIAEQETQPEQPQEVSITVDNTEQIAALETELKTIENEINVAYQTFVGASANQSGTKLKVMTDLQQKAKQIREDILILKNEGLEQLFYNSELSKAQNCRINILVNKWKESDKYIMQAVYKCLGDSKQSILHVKTTSQDMYMTILLDGSPAGSKSSLDSIYDKVELLHDFTSENAYNSERITEPSETNITAGSIYTYPEIEIDDSLDEKYNISQSLQDREHDSAWIMRSTKSDHNKEIQELFISYTEQVKAIITTTINEYYIYKLKESLQRFKKNYHSLYVKYLNQKANTPSWVVTGRSGLNVSRYNKKMDQQNKTMMELAALPDEFKSKLNYYKNKIQKDKEQSIKNQINKMNTDIQFTTGTKEFIYMGIKEKKRVYVYDNYFICKLWACFRIFDIRTIKEVHSMKTTEKLEDAKKHVAYLVQTEKQAS